MNNFNKLCLHYEKRANNVNSQQGVWKQKIKQQHKMKHKGNSSYVAGLQECAKLNLELEAECKHTFVDLLNYENWLGNNGNERN